MQQREEKQTMAQYYVDHLNDIVRFEDDDWMRDADARAQIWSPHSEEWRDVPPGTGLSASVKWSGDYYPVPEDEVPAAQARLRRQWIRDGRSKPRLTWPPVWIDGRLVKIVCDQPESSR
jgi:hypothetical protein